jgi:hypothetical protein
MTPFVIGMIWGFILGVTVGVICSKDEKGDNT